MTLELKSHAAKINEEHRAGNTAALQALDHYRRAGDLLNEVKDALPHGEFGPWLEANFEGSQQTANNYMRVAKNWDALNYQHVGSLSLRAALAELAAPKEDSEEQAEAGKWPGYLAQTPERLKWFCNGWYDDRLFLTLLLDAAGDSAEAISERLGVEVEETLMILDPRPPARFELALDSYWIEGNVQGFKRAYRAAVNHWIHNSKWRGYERASWGCSREGYPELRPALEALTSYHKRAADRFREEIFSFVSMARDLQIAFMLMTMSDADHALGVCELEPKLLGGLKNLHDVFAEPAAYSAQQIEQSHAQA